MKITEEMRRKLHEERYSVEILQHKDGIVVIVGDECYQHVNHLEFKAGKNEKTLRLDIDAESFAKEFLASTNVKANEIQMR